MVDDRNKEHKPSSLEKFFLHLHPVRIDSRALKFSRTFGLGGILALLFLILSATGLLLRFSYVPTVEHAYGSIVDLQNKTTFGLFIRNLHHVSANLMVVVSFLHLVRVYYSQSIYGERYVNWIYGLLLMFLVLAFSFTGYLLPWDQLSFWAVTVVTQIIDYIPLVGHSIANGIRGGETVNANTLLNFYSLHTGILPLLFIILASMHFWLVRKAGGVALPQTDDIRKVEVIPNLIGREKMVAAIVLAVVFLFSVFYQSPLMEQANPSHSPNPTKAPWYFLGAQELLLQMHPLFSAVLIPIVVVAFFFYLPFFKYMNQNTGVWFNSPLGRKMVIYSALFSMLFTFFLIYLLDHFLHFDKWLSGAGNFVSVGLVPFLLYTVPVALFLRFWKVKKGAKTEELVMATTTVLLASYTTMLLIALLLRGEGMLMVF